MSWLFLILLLSFVFSDVSEAGQGKKLPSAVVVGTVFCDTCFQEDFFRDSRFISGASVAVECMNKNSTSSFRREVKTDEHGEFRVHLPFSVSKHVKKIKRCSVKLISSSEPYCSVASSATSSSLHLKSRKEGIHIFSAGFFTFKPLKQPTLCNQKPSVQNSAELSTKKASVTSVGDPTFPPPIEDPTTPDFPPIPFLPRLLPLPQLPPLPPLPGLPNLPPMPGNTKHEAKPNGSPKEVPPSTDQKTAQPEFSLPSMFPPNPFQPPPLLPFPPNPFQPSPSFPPNPLQPPPTPLIPLPPIPGLTPPPPAFPFPLPPIPGLTPPPPPAFPFPLPPFPFPIPPPGTPPASTTTTKSSP